MKKIYFLLVLFSFQISLAQVTNEAIPRGWNINLKNQPVKIVLPTVDVESLRAEDALEAEKGIKTYRFGQKIPVQLDLFNSGQWSDLENGDRIWRLNIESKNARTMNFLFDRYDLPKGAEMYLYNDNRSDRLGPYTSNENQEDGVLGSWIIYGDNVWIEYYEPAAVKNQGRLSIEQVVHGYRGFGKAEEDYLKLNESGACNVDVMCNPNQGSTNGVDWTTARDNYRHAVARIIINGASLCTGTMINNVREDATPYFLTADHCLGNTGDGASSSYNGSNWAFGFDWFTNTPDCATFTNTTGPFSPTRVITGAVLRANRGNSDFALFELNQFPPAAWNLYYAGWDRSATASTSQLSIHHPSGDIMKLSRNDQVVTTIFPQGSAIECWRIADWDYGVTEGGSSGSCLLNSNGLIIGQLLGGFAACSGTVDNGTEDWYGKMNVSWSAGFNAATRLRDWLDPDGTNATSLDGEYYAVLNNEEVPTALTIDIYPNPSNGIFTIDTDRPLTYGVFDLSGKLIQEGAINDLQSQLDIQNLSNGIYFLKLQDGDKSITKKIAKM